MPKPTETVPLILRYEGPDVDDGSMSLEDIVPVLQGFASAYGKIAADQGIGVQHRIRITGVKQSSADILLEVWEFLATQADPLTSVSVLGGAAASIVGSIVGVIRLKKHLKKKPFTTRIANTNTVTVINSENVKLEMPISIFNIYQSHLIDHDVAKIARPLHQGRINAAEIIADIGPEQIRETILASDREYLETEEVTVTSTKETWITGKLNSLTKSTNSGWLYLLDGTRLFYKWVGDSPAKLHLVFGSYDGPVRVYGVAQMDASLKVTQIEITDIEKLQGELFPPVPEGGDEDDSGR